MNMRRGHVGGGGSGADRGVGVDGIFITKSIYIVYICIIHIPIHTYIYIQRKQRRSVQKMKPH